MFMLQKIVRDKDGFVVGKGEVFSVLSKDVALSRVRRGEAEFLGEREEEASREPPGGEPPPALVARLRAEGKLPAAPAQETPAKPGKEPAKARKG